MWKLKKIAKRLVEKKLVFRNKDIKLICQDRCLKLFYRDIELSDDIGVHASILVDNTWFDSHQGIWQINVKENTLHITIDWKDLPIRQLWNIKKVGDGFMCAVYIDVKEKINIKRLQAGIILKEDYNQWFSGVEKGNFPDFTNSWLNIFRQDLTSKVFGVKNDNGLANIIFENLRSGQSLLQNTPISVARSRVLHIEVDNHDEVLLPKRYKYFCFALFAVKEKEEFLKLQTEKINRSLKLKQLQDGNLKIKLDSTKLKLYWQDREITTEQGLHAALLINNEWHDSSKCKWEIESINEKCVLINIDWRPLPIAQTWQLLLANGNSFLWQTKILSKDEAINIEQQTLGLVLKSEYKEWFSGAECGVFPEQFEKWQPMTRENLNATVGVKNYYFYPGIMFKNKGVQQAELLVQNGDANSKARFVQAIQKNKPKQSCEQSQAFDFSQEVTFVEDISKIEDYIQQKTDEIILQRGIERDNVRLIADGQRLRIFYKGNELTTDIGMHTAICSNDYWYYSGDLKLDWIIDKQTPYKFTITVDFRPLFPVIQIWELSIDDNTMINWTGFMELKEPVQIQERKAGIILQDSYARWFNSFEHGFFPQEFMIWHDIIRSRNTENFGVFPEGNLPGVMFAIDANHLSLIQNTDKNISGRAFQAQRVEIEETRQYNIGTFEFFRGQIKIVEDERVIKDFIKDATPLLLEEEAIYFYGDSEELHNRIAGTDEFTKKIERIKSLKKEGKNTNIKIGVSRYNFFKLHEVIQFVMGILGKYIDLRSLKLNIFPASKLRRHFIEYLEELKTILPPDMNIRLVLVDDKLFDIITEIYTQATRGNERQLLRLLGVICEHAFIGPQIVVMDPYHRCNANCIHCWVHTPTINHPQSFLNAKLDFELYKKTIDDLSELFADLIIFQGDGEPLLYDKFFEMVRYARNKGLKVSFFTNGILLNKKVARELIDLGIEEVFCSFPAGKAQTYAMINTKQNQKVFYKVLENLKYLCDLKKELKVDKPRLIMTHVIHTMNAQELIDMAKNDIEIGANIMRFYLIRLDKNIEFLKLTKNDLEIIKISMSKIKELAKDKPIKLLDTTDFQLDHFEQETGSWSKDIFLEKGCTLGWNFCLIPAQGDISFCCHLRTVGYLKKNSFKEIWASKEYDRFRYQAKFLKKHAKAKFLNGTPLFDEYCGHCDTHQVIRDVWNQMKLYGLEKFINVT